MPRIQRLDLCGFRGALDEASLLFDGNSLLLFGENGTGKSSFVDALEKLFTGKVATLDARAQGLSSDRHGPHIHLGNNPVRIGVTFADSLSTTFALHTDRAHLPDGVRKYLDSASENLYILRRRQILDFIDCLPSDRYELLRPFLPLSGFEQMENELRIAKERAGAAAQRASQQLTGLTNQLRRELGLPIADQTPTEADIVQAISQILGTVGQASLEQFSQLDESVRRLDAVLAPFGDLTRQTRISSVMSSLEQLREAIASSALIQCETALEELRSREAQEAQVFYEAVLEQGIRWIQEERRQSCPLCEQEIKPDQTVGLARQRLDAMRQILDLRHQSRHALDHARQTTQSAQEALGRATRAADSLASADRGPCLEVLQEVATALQRSSTALDGELRAIKLEDVRAASTVVRENSPLLLRVAAEEARLQQLLALLPSPELARRLLSARNTIIRVKEIWAENSNARTTINQFDQQAVVAARLHEDARTARREAVQAIFDELSQDIDNLYCQLHPGESHGGIRLEVREVGQGSVNLRGNYYDRTDEDPRAYYSDAHLDTLGLSIFLALRRWHRKQHPEFDLLVLDDVLTSVDVHHVVRLSELLLREFKDYQILLTTHDRIWFEHLRDIQARCRVAHQFVNKVIHKWTIEEGPDIRQPEDERQDIEHLISEGSAEQIAALGGRLLEHILQEMRYSLRMSVQAKPGELYEIGDLWPPFYATVKKQYPTLFERARNTLDALDVRWPVRNWIGAHRNDWARNVPRNAGIEFARAVRDLFDLVFCVSCRRFVTPSVTPLGQLACRCGEKIYPAPGKAAVRPKTREELIRETAGALREAHLDTSRYLAWKHAEAAREH